MEQLEECINENKEPQSVPESSRKSVTLMLIWYLNA